MIEDVLEIQLPTNELALWFFVDEISFERVFEDRLSTINVKTHMHSKYITDLADFQSKFRNKKVDAIVRNGKFKGTYYGGYITHSSYDREQCRVSFSFDNVSNETTYQVSMSETIRKELGL